VIDEQARGDPQVRFFTHVAADAGYPVRQGATLLDFGCGEGEGVEAWDRAGFDSFGCDIVLDKPTERLVLIEEPYRIPFPDNTFDVIVSDEVFEHVQDYAVVLPELRRVLKPSGVSLHVFPARWVFLEPHALVPLATVVQPYWWIAIWARLGIRNRFQQRKPWQQVARENTDFLHNQTNYPPSRRLLAQARRWFDDARFLNALAIKHGNRSRAIYPLVRVFPPVADVYGTLRARLLMLR
jgi:SAM-dependent methyltransferase